MYYSVENNTTEVDKFNKILNNLLENLKSKAASGDSRRKYGVGSASVGPRNITIYGVVQCTPDLSEKECDDCLVESIQLLPTC
ncbi:hypothetical protein HN51_056912 [Arachis hypogaea]